MKKFIYKTSAFLLASLAMIVLIFFIVLSNAEANTEAFRLDQEVKTIFLGDSHIQKGINDTLYSGVLNSGRSSETTYHSFYKLKAILASENRVENVVLGFGYHNLSNYSDEFIFGNKSRVLGSPYFHLLPKEDQMKLFRVNKHVLPQFAKSILKDLLKTNNTSGSPFPGKFKNEFKSTEARDSSILKRLKIQFGHLNNNQGKKTPFSELNITFLDSIKKLTSSKGIAFYLINAPIYQEYRKNVPHVFLDKYNSLISSLEIRTIELAFEESKRSYFIPDGDHLSAEGAIEFTKQLRNSPYSFLFGEHSNQK